MTGLAPSPIVLYIGTYKEPEQEALRVAGVRVERLRPGTDAANALSAIKGSRDVFLRSGRLSASAFEQIWTTCSASGVELVTTPPSFAAATSFAEHYPHIRSLSPKAIVVHRDATALDLLRAVADARLMMPLFVRSDRESAAKYVGVEGCLLRENSASAADRILGNLRKNVKAYDYIIVKEHVTIGRSEQGEPLEFRAIGAKGRLICFDLPDKSSGRPHPDAIGLTAVAEGTFQSLDRAGISGALFVDFAITESPAARPIVVECKDFSDGSIAAPDVLARGLRRWLRA